MKQSVSQLSQELVQLGSGGVDQVGPGPAQHSPVEPVRQAGGHGGRQGAGEAKEAGEGEEELLLSARHDDGGTEGGTEVGGWVRLLPGAREQAS